MVYRGYVQNGVVIFDDEVRLRDGTHVRIETMVGETACHDPATDKTTSDAGPSQTADGGFWGGATIGELADRQQVSVLECGDELFGGWPSEELHDGFEEAISRWREDELERNE